MGIQPSPPEGPPGLRRKAFLLAFGLVLLALVINTLFGDNGVFHLLAQRRKSVALEQTIEQLREENTLLAREIAALRSDPLTVERLAREELGLTAAGETVFLIHQPEPSDGL
jgi:cell division protein FtsB